MDCDEIALLIPSYLDGDERADENVVEHVSECLRCQAELSRYRKLVRILGDFSSFPVEVPSGLALDVIGSLGARARRHAVRSALSQKRVAYILGLSVSLVAGTALARAHRTHAARAVQIRR